MRGILTTSLPQEVIAELRKKAKKMGISLSQFILHLFYLEKTMISEKDLLKFIAEAEKEHRQKKTQKINSLADLM